MDPLIVRHATFLLGFLVCVLVYPVDRRSFTRPHFDILPESGAVMFAPPKLVLENPLEHVVLLLTFCIVRSY